MGRLAFLVLAALLVSGCELLLPDEPAPPRWFPRQLPLDSRVVLRLEELLGPGHRMLILWAETERGYGDNFATLDYTLERSGYSFRLRLRGVSSSCTLCPDVMGPARAWIRLGTLSPGHYEIAVEAKDTTVIAGLAVTPDSFRVVGGEGPWSTFSERILHRVPDRTIWGVVWGPPGDPEGLIPALLEALQQAGAREEPFIPGFYAHFTVGPDGRIEAPGGADAAFLYRFDGDYAALPEVLRAHGAGLHYYVLTERGEVFRG